MSLKLSKEDVLFHQRILKASGYDLVLDGIWGKHTDAADKDFNDHYYSLQKSLGLFDARSEKNIMSLVLAAQAKSRLFLKQSIMEGYDARIISGTRSYSEQNNLYAQGRTQTGSIVTNAKGGQSLHNFGIAWDIGLFIDGKYILDNKYYINFHNKIFTEGLEWGGSWKSIQDTPHYELKPISDSISIVRNNFENGLKYF